MSVWIIVFVSGLIKFFGNVTQSWPKEVFAEYPTIVTALFETFDNSDLVLLGVAMETVGYIGTTVEGKYMLESLGMSHSPFVKLCGSHLELTSNYTVSLTGHSNPDFSNTVCMYFEEARV
jgi:26S proteasome non-ATPase regulatory subunit 5